MSSTYKRRVAYGWGGLRPSPPPQLVLVGTGPSPLDPLSRIQCATPPLYSPTWKVLDFMRGRPLGDKLCPTQAFSIHWGAGGHKLWGGAYRTLHPYMSSRLYPTPLRVTITGGDIRGMDAQKSPPYRNWRRHAHLGWLKKRSCLVDYRRVRRALKWSLSELFSPNFIFTCILQFPPPLQKALDYYSSSDVKLI